MCCSRGTEGSSLRCAQLWTAHPPTLSPTAVGAGCGHSPHLMGDTWMELHSPAEDPSVQRQQQWLSESRLVSLIAALLLPSTAAAVLLFLFPFPWKSAEQLVLSLVKHPRVMKRVRLELFLLPDAGGAGGGSQELMCSLCHIRGSCPSLCLVIFHLPEAPLTPAGNRAAEHSQNLSHSISVIFPLPSGVGSSFQAAELLPACSQ